MTHKAEKDYSNELWSWEFGNNPISNQSLTLKILFEQPKSDGIIPQR